MKLVKETVQEEPEVNYLHFPGEARPDCPDDEYVSMREAQKMLGLDRRVIQDLIDNGTMAEVKKCKFPPAYYTFRKSDLIDFRIKYTLKEEAK